MFLVSLMLWVLWNLFLAGIPVGLAMLIHYIARQPGQPVQRRVLLGMLGAIWLAFLPNTCYLLTEWRHYLHWLTTYTPYQRWHVQGEGTAVVEMTAQALFYLAYSGAGVFTFTLAIRPLRDLLVQARRPVWPYAIPLFLLCALGVYLGLVLRFNSWELLTRPEVIWAAVAEVPTRPLLTAVIFAFAGVLWAAFWLVDVWVDGFALRWRRNRGQV